MNSSEKTDKKTQRKAKQAQEKDESLTKCGKESVLEMPLLSQRNSPKMGQN